MLQAEVYDSYGRYLGGIGSKKVNDSWDGVVNHQKVAPGNYFIRYRNLDNRVVFSRITQVL